MIKQTRLKFFYTLFCVIYIHIGYTQVYFVDPQSGLDSNVGTEDNPFKTLSKSVEVANQQTGKGTIKIKLLPGNYLLNDKIAINPIRIFDDTARFIIEAMILPDDPSWNPEKMPIIQSISGNNSSTFFNHAVGFLIATNKVTIRGLKFLGNANPSVSYYYPITKEDKNLEELEVVQCMFVGSKEAARIQGGIWAHGPKNTVDHCVFYECRNAVLFFDNVSGFRISNSIITKSYESAFWLGPDDIEFEFFNNIIVENNNVIVGQSEDLVYSSPLKKSIITANAGFVGYWSSEKGGIIPIKAPNVQLRDIENETVEIHENKEAAFEKRHLHLKPHSVGIKYNAGIFKAARK